MSKKINKGVSKKHKALVAPIFNLISIVYADGTCNDFVVNSPVAVNNGVASYTDQEGSMHVIVVGGGTMYIDQISEEKAHEFVKELKSFEGDK